MILDKGINVSYIISKKPEGSPLADWVIPTMIFEMDPQIMWKMIWKWCKDSSITDFSIRSLLDWDYYKERIGNIILKFITIPAALQGCKNPFPKVVYPDWLNKKIKEMSSVFKQRKLLNYFAKAPDIEDFGKRDIIMTDWEK